MDPIGLFEWSMQPLPKLFSGAGIGLCDVGRQVSVVEKLLIEAPALVCMLSYEAYFVLPGHILSVS